MIKQWQIPAGAATEVELACLVKVAETLRDVADQILLAARGGKFDKLAITENIPDAERALSFALDDSCITALEEAERIK